MQRRFIVLREAARFLPHGHDDASVSEMRQLSLSIAETDKNFEILRVKIHIHPELSDAADVRAYAEKSGISELRSQYERLATIIEEVYKRAHSRCVSRRSGFTGLKKPRIVRATATATTLLTRNTMRSSHIAECPGGGIGRRTRFRS